MAVVYLLVAVYILIMNIAEVPAMIALIVRSALGLEQAAGGAIGYTIGQAMMQGVRRGLFSNEAGMGSAPNIAATATPQPHHPVSQGFVQGLGPFFDTILICTATAVVILLSGAYDMASSGAAEGVKLTQNAIEDHVGHWGSIFIAVILFFFALTSIVANYSYAENSIIFLKLERWQGLNLLRLGCLAMVFWGSLTEVQMVWAVADTAMGMMASVNLIGILLLSGIVYRLTKDYLEQSAAGKVPKFDIRDHPDLVEKGVDASIWK